MLRVVPPANQTCLAAYQGVAGCKKLMQSREQFYFFLQQNLYMLRRETCFAESDVSPGYGVTPS